VLAPPAMYYSPRLSHDEKRVAVDLSDTKTASGDIWLIDVAQGSQTRLTHDPANESSPLWSVDDRRMFYFSEKRGHQDLYARASSGTGSDEAVLTGEHDQIPLDLSPDGRFLAYTVATGGSTNSDLWVLDLSTRKSTPLVISPFIEAALQFSPDGKWIAYVSDESGRDEVYVQQFPESAGKQIISRGGGSAPGWSADSRQLYYVSPDRILMSVPLSLGASIDAGAPIPLFEARLRNFGRQYIVSRDGSRFLLNRTVGESGSRPMTLVQNWIPQPNQP
jgi:Tol biopolymer transport system component